MAPRRFVGGVGGSGGQEEARFFERMRNQQADPEYRANRYLNRWVQVMSEYQGLKNPTVEQADALQRKVRSVAEDIQKDYRASALISTGQVQVTGVQPFSLLARSLDVADLLKGQVPSRSLGLSRNGPDIGPEM